MSVRTLELGGKTYCLLGALTGRHSRDQPWFKSGIASDAVSQICSHTGFLVDHILLDMSCSSNLKVSAK